MKPITVTRKPLKAYADTPSNPWGVDVYTSTIDLTDAFKLVVRGIEKDNKEQRVDIRIFQTTDAYTGATKKGINIEIEHLDSLIQSLNELKKSMEE